MGINDFTDSEAAIIVSQFVGCEPEDLQSWVIGAVMFKNSDAGREERYRLAGRCAHPVHALMTMHQVMANVTLRLGEILMAFVKEGGENDDDDGCDYPG